MRRMTHSLVLDDAIFPKHYFSKQYKLPPDYYAAAKGFPKRGQKSPYTTEKLLAVIPRAPAPKKYSNETISAGRSYPPEQTYPDLRLPKTRE
jgi:hypothetical protein